MFLWFSNLSHVSQALIAALFTWSVTMLGAAIVFFFKEVKKGIKLLDEYKSIVGDKYQFLLVLI